MPDFAKLENVDLREAWSHEAHDFTPWLAHNLDRLSEVISIPLELEDSEVRVDQFSADILARNAADGSLVLIENQLEVTDHTHLGQILTYLAGINAQTVVWVARDFTEAHLSAVRWLNEHTADPFAFLAVRVRVVRIAESPIAPTFEVLERPSEWDRRLRVISLETGLSEIGQFRREFWEFYAQRHPNEGIRPGYAGSYVRHSVEGLEITVSQYLAQREVGIYLFGSAGWAQVESYAQHLSSELGVAMGSESGSWGLSILSIASTDRNNWPRMADWLHEKLCAYRDALKKQTSSASPY